MITPGLGHKAAIAMESSTPLHFHARVAKPVFLGLIWTFTAVSFLFVAFRISVRASQFRRLFIDDGLVLLSWAIMLATSIIWQIEGQFLYRLYAVVAGTEPFTSDVLPKYNTLMRFIAPLSILFYSGLWCIKFSFLAFFLRLGSKVKGLRTWWYIVLFATIAGYAASIGDIEYKCSFGGAEYITVECPKMSHVAFEYRTFWANCVADIVTDLMILSIPFLMLWNTRVPLRNKIILFGVFSATTVIMAVAIIRVAVNGDARRSADISWLYLWNSIEMGTAIIVSCVASFRQLFIVTESAPIREGCLPVSAV